MQEQCCISILENCSVTLGLLMFKNVILTLGRNITNLFSFQERLRPLGANLVLAVHEAI
jgi:hypothetical protein